MQFYDNMPRTRQREIVIEYERIQLIRRRARTERTKCKSCGCDVDFIPIASAAEIFGTTLSELYRYLQINECHVRGEPGQTIQICIPSLLACLKTKTLNQIKMIGESK